MRTGLQFQSAENGWFIAFAGFALAVLAAASSARGGTYFLFNFAFFLAAQALPLVPLLALTRRPALAGGALAAIALCFAGLSQSSGWVLFMFCMPGAAIGTGVAGCFANWWTGRSAGAAAARAAAITLAATLINAAWLTVWF